MFGHHIIQGLQGFAMGDIGGEAFGDVRLGEAIYLVLYSRVIYIEVIYEVAAVAEFFLSLKLSMCFFNLWKN